MIGKWARFQRRNGSVYSHFGLAVAVLMKRPDIIRRAFRGTGVGIDIEGKMIAHIRFPGFETYEPPTKDEEHLDELLTEDEIKELERREIEYQKQQKKRKEGERDEGGDDESQRRVCKHERAVEQQPAIHLERFPEE